MMIRVARVASGPTVLALAVGAIATLPCAIAAADTTPPGLHKRIDERVAATQAKVVAWRRDFHQHPELGNREERTAKIVADHLKALGLDVQTGVAHTGVVGLLKGGKPGPVVALRADMDALPITEESDLPFKSTVKAKYNGLDVGVMHACGHDAHTAILMGVAEVLAEVKADLPGSVKFIFQPAEEGPPPGEAGGARLMVAQGVLDNPKVDAIFGLHVMSRSFYDLEFGHIATRPGGLLAQADNLKIVVRGRGAHGATPWRSVDPVTVAAQISLALQTIPSRQVDLTAAPVVISVGSIHGGTRHNIIPDSVTMEGTVRTFDGDTQKDVHARIKRTAENIAAAAGATAEVTLVVASPGILNDAVLIERILPALQRVTGNHATAAGRVSTGAEDFSIFQQRVPGVYFCIGASPAGKRAQDVAPNHSPRFVVDEGVLPIGVRALAHVAADALSAGRR